MYKKNYSKNNFLKHMDFACFDLVIIEINMLVLSYIRNGNLFHSRYTLTFISLFLIGLIHFVVMFINDSYKNILKRESLNEIKAVFIHMSYLNILFMFCMYAIHMSYEFSRYVYFSMWFFNLVVSFVIRQCWKYFVVSKKATGIGKSIIVVTTFDNAEKCITSLTEKIYSDFTITGVCMLDKDMEGESILGYPIVANIDSLLQYVQINWVDEIFFRFPQNHDIEEYGPLMNACEIMGITYHLAIVHKGTLLSGIQMVEEMGGYTVLTYSMRIASSAQSTLKRLIDICGGLVGSCFTILLILIVGPIIYIKSPGPIFFSQERIGKNGKHFKMYKFRSMYMDAEERKKELMSQNKMSGLMFKIDNDPRIIKGIGHFIRNTSIDEFPQFFNVLKGDMSLVGTRPPTVDEWEKYELHHRARLAIKPGITGMWQVSGRSDITDFEEVVRLDTQYINEWSIGVDIKILLNTIRVVLKREGSV